MTDSTVDKMPTSIMRAPPRIDYKWEHPAGSKDHNLWQNVEYVSIKDNI